MKSMRGVVVCLLVLAAAGCGATTRAAATRVLDPDSGALSAAPVCFVPPDPGLGLTERAQRASVLHICEDAARAQGVSVVGMGSGQCLAATLEWAIRDTGDRDGECARTWGGGAECYSRAVRIKTLKVTLAQPSGKVVAETTAAIRSSRAEFSRETLHALCTAAFQDFPQPMSNSQFDVSVD